MEQLDKNIFVCIDENHRFGSDAFLLADFANPRRKDYVCDLGTGCGIIPMVMCKRFSPKSIVGVDLQEDAIKLFSESILNSKVSTRLTPLLCDMKTLQKDHQICH